MLKDWRTCESIPTAKRRQDGTHPLYGAAPWFALPISTSATLFETAALFCLEI
jgi:hypothetical protein